MTLTGYNAANSVVGTQVVSLTTAGGHQQVRSACAACASLHDCQLMQHESQADT